MAGIRLPPEDSDLAQTRPGAGTGAEFVSDDDRSVAADSWSIKSDYGSTLDDDQRHADATDALSLASLRLPSDYSSDKEEPDNEDEVEPSMLGLHSYWDSTYAEELTNFHEHGHTGEIWFGADVMETVASWTKSLCLSFSKDHADIVVENNASKSDSDEDISNYLSAWNVLDIGTGNGLLLQELAKQGFSDLTGTDYSESAIELARNLASRDGHTCINFLVDNILETSLEKQYRLVMDKGTLDAIGLHPDGPVKRIMYWDSIWKLLAPGGILVVTSCNHTKDELVQEVENFNLRKQSNEHLPPLRYLDHVKTYPTFMFGGVVGSRVATVSFARN